MFKSLTASFVLNFILGCHFNTAFAQEAQIHPVQPNSGLPGLIWKSATRSKNNSKGENTYKLTGTFIQPGSALYLKRSEKEVLKLKTKKSGVFSIKLSQSEILTHLNFFSQNNWGKRTGATYTVIVEPKPIEEDEAPAQESEWHLDVDSDYGEVESTPNLNSTKIENIVFENSTLLLQREILKGGAGDQDSQVRFVTKVNGRFITSQDNAHEIENWSLVQIPKTPIKPNPDGTFTATVIFTKPVETLAFFVIGADGKCRKIEYTLKFENLEELIKTKGAPNEEWKRKILFVRLDLSQIHYTETNPSPTDYKMLAPVIKADYAMGIFNPNWKLVANAFFTPFAISSSNNQISVRFLGVNLGISRLLNFIKRPWDLSVAGGAYFNMMFVTNNSFGYSPVFFPHLSSVFGYTFNSKDRLTLGLKVVSLNRNLNIFRFSEREISIHLGFTRKLENGHALLFSAVLSDFAILFDNGSANLTTYAIGAGYQL